MGTAISNYDDKHAIPTIGRRQEACLIRSGLCGPTLFQVSERYPLLAPQLIAIYVSYLSDAFKRYFLDVFEMALTDAVNLGAVNLGAVNLGAVNPSKQR